MIIVVDTGGTKTLVSSFKKDGSVSSMVKFPTPKDSLKYIIALRQEIEDITAKNRKVDAIVIALPGVIKDGVAQWCHNLGWRDFDVRKALGNLGAPVFVENDANLAGLAETRLLKPTPISSLYVTVSTGIGTGFVVDGKIDRGLQHSEGGHMLVEYDGRVREWEEFASGQAIYNTYGKYARDITSKRQWKHIADRISRGFLAVIPLTQPDIIIIGGSIGTYFDRYGFYLEQLITERLPADIPCPKIIQARHPEHAVIYGGYYYALDLSTRKKSR